MWAYVNFLYYISLPQESLDFFHLGIEFEELSLVVIQDSNPRVPNFNYNCLPFS